MAPRKLPKDALLTEILQKVSSAKTKKEKIELLQELFFYYPYRIQE